MLTWHCRNWKLFVPFVRFGMLPITEESAIALGYVSQITIMSFTEAGFLSTPEQSKVHSVAIVWFATI